MHTKCKKIAMVALLLAFAVSFAACSAPTKYAHEPRARNVIFMVPDGMGLADVTSARIFKYGPNGDRLSFEKLPVIGYESTHSANSTVTDSAAAASAWASGAKFNNGEISCHDDDFDGACDNAPGPTLLDLAKAGGKATGLVATSDITHATPAAFGANVHNRKCEEEIARQYLARRIDVLLGGGIAANRGSCKLATSGVNFLDSLLKDYADAGYAMVKTKAELNAAVNQGAEKLLGLFKSGGKTQELYRVDPSHVYQEGEPTLPEMTRSALAVLEKSEKGFFLVVEGSQIDWANHANDIQGQIAETLAFDAAVQVVLDWVNTHPPRNLDTLVVVAPDHETGGYAINGPHGTLSRKGDIIQDKWTSTEHTATDVLIWAQGPGSQNFGRAFNNTDLFSLIKQAMR
ncbi:MAG: alkaline phosphatase [Desulfosarcinaceae bacterium]